MANNNVIGGVPQKVMYLGKEDIKSEKYLYMRFRNEYGEKNPLDKGNEEVYVYVVVKEPEHLTFNQIVIIDLCLHKHPNVRLAVKRHKNQFVKGLLKTYRVIQIEELLYISDFKLITINIPEQLLTKRSEKGNYYYYNEYRDYKYKGEPAVHYFAMKETSRILRLARKALNRLQEIDYKVYTKEYSSYDGDNMTECPQKESTDSKIRTDKHYYKTFRYMYINNFNLLTPKDRMAISRWKCPKYTKIQEYTKENVIQDYVIYYHDKYKEDDRYQNTIRKFFLFGKKIDITTEVIEYMINTLTKMCQDYVEQSSDSAYEFISNFVNIHLRYEEYLEMNQVLQLPAIVDFVVSNMIRERDVEVESFYEDRKDDDYESINSSYLGNDD